MRHLKGRDQLIFYASALIPVFFPWLALAVALIAPGYWPITAIYFLVDYLIFAYCNHHYLGNASPWSHSYLVTVISIFLPLQILAALLAPQRIIWRGHVMQAEPGGGFKFLRRRNGPPRE